jgi:hypothetical protein
MELPIEIQRIITDYAKPRTRPNWRSLHIMTSDKFSSQVVHSFITNPTLAMKSLLIHHLDDTWFEIVF